MSGRPLTPPAVRRSAAKLIEDLGRADRKRLESLLALFGESARIPLAAALGALFPDQGREAALTAFRQFRSRIRDAAGEIGLGLALEADGQTRAAPEERWCWFEGDDGAAEAFERRTEEETAAVERVGQSGMELPELRDGKPVVRYFVSYAHGDSALKSKLLDKLSTFLAIAKDYSFEAWDDHEILAGDGWNEEIQAAIARCRFGLLLVSPKFLASPYITQQELPAFVAADIGASEPGKRAIPVALKRLPFDGSIDLKGLERCQLFHDADGKVFQERSTDKTCEDFARQLFQQILKVVARHVPPPLPSSPPRPGHSLELAQRRHIDGALDWNCHVPSRGFSSSFDTIEVEDGEVSPEVEPIDALAFLEEWIGNPQAQPYFALLGDLGMGKTTTCMSFARSLLDQRRRDPALPLPIYLDLRLLGDKARAEPGLKTILETVLARSWRGGHGEADLSAEEALRLVQAEGAVAIFDGLDEVLVHLSKAAGQRFVREIFRILPPLPAKGRGVPAPGRRGRLLMACRTHYFRSLREQKTFLTGEDRDAIRADDYRALVLLPFTEKQIRAYLEHSLPGEDPERVLALIRAVHNLSEMAERPYTLTLISRHIPQIERWQSEGRRVTGVMLYRHLVLSWLERDDGKHQILPEHKRRLMEHLAAELWRSGRRHWSVDDLEQWLIDFLGRRPEIAAHYGEKDRELLKEDLRTATFLVREGEEGFRFAHTSLQEFFLAGYLHDALLRNAPERWDLPIPSRETLDFLGQLLAEDETGREPCVGTLRTLRDAYRPRASELAFAYALLALRKGYPSPSPAGFRLEGADLREWELAGRENEPRVNLRGASFRGARLDGATFFHLDLQDADFRGADLSRAEWRSVRASGACLASTDLPGTLFRQCHLAGADLSGSRFHRTRFLQCDLDDATGIESTPPAVFLVGCELADFRAPPVNPRSARLAVLDGHGGPVTACAFAPDGRRLASASEDHTLRLWDTQTGECLAVLRGHEDRVLGCAFATDGRHLGSASSDGNLRMWDVESGECLSVLSGHEGSVSSCTFTPDGQRLVSASSDETLRVWDVHSGECLSVLSGHEGTVWGCAFAPDGQRVVSASSDKTLRVWDAHSGECLSVLRGHEDGVTDCAFAPDGQTLVSASWDQTLRVWDSESGECVAVLRGHEFGVTGCAFATDDQRLVSASADGSLRVWDAQDGECVAVLRGHEDEVSGCAFAPDSKRIVSASSDRTLRMWDALSGECVAVLRGHEGEAWSCAFAPDGQRLVSASLGEALRVWDAQSSECVVVLRGRAAGMLAPDGQRLASASADGALRVWDTRSGECLAVLRGHENTVFGCAFAADGERLVSASLDRTLRVWDAQSGECRAVLRGHENGVTGCAFAPDGQRLVSASSDGTLRVWDAQSGECRAVLRGHENMVFGCAFAPDGQRLVSASWDGTLRVWDAPSGECRAVLRGHEGGVLGCAFAPDGQRLVSASLDRTLRLWDAQSGECVAVLRGHDAGVSSCAFSPDGQLLISASWDGSLRFWDAETGAPLGRQIRFFANGAWASIDLDQNRIIQVAGDAWRWLGWQTIDPVDGRAEVWPAEVFGSLPVYG